MTLERERKRKKREKNEKQKTKSEHPTPLFSVVFEFFFFSSSFFSVILVSTKRTRVVWYDYILRLLFTPSLLMSQSARISRV